MPRLRTKRKYTLAKTKDGLLQDVADAFEEANYCLTNTVKAILESGFVWSLSYSVSPLGTTAPNMDTTMACLWTLYAIRS